MTDSTKTDSPEMSEVQALEQIYAHVSFDECADPAALKAAIRVMEDLIARLKAAETGTMKFRAQLYTLIISHKHGIDTSVHASHDEAMHSLANYCRSWWDDRADKEAGDDPSDLDDTQVVATYFDDHETEWYAIESVYAVLPLSSFMETV